MIPIVIDTAEQRPWSFPADRFTTVRRKIPTGDYTIEGYEDRLTIERKSLGDFVGTVIHDWLRFRKELNRMMLFDAAIIAVECNVEDVMRHRYESATEPQSVMGRAHSIYLDTGIPVLFWGPRACCERQAWHFLEKAWERFR